MERDAALAVGFALLAVVALGVAAATLDTAVEYDPSGGVGAGDVDGTGIGERSEDDRVSSEPAPPLDVDPILTCQPWLGEPPFAFGLLALFGLLFVAIYRSTDSVFAGGVLALLFVFPPSVVWYVLAFCGRTPTQTADPSFGFGNVTEGDSIVSGGGATGTGGEFEALSAPTMVVALLLVVAVVASVFLLFLSGRDDDGDRGNEGDVRVDDAPVVETGALGRAAGAAADRIEDDADVDNEVYRAWREMTDHLDVDRPESSTPSEFADVAVDAGMDPPDVRALTDVFEEVRYGGVEATDDRERRAVEALRRIESAYAEEDR